MQLLLALTVLALFQLPSAIAKPQINAADSATDSVPITTSANKTAPLNPDPETTEMIQETTAPVTDSEAPTIDDLTTDSPITNEFYEIIYPKTKITTTPVPTTPLPMKFHYNYTIDMRCNDLPLSGKWLYMVFIQEYDNSTMKAGSVFTYVKGWAVDKKREKIEIVTRDVFNTGKIQGHFFTSSEPVMMKLSIYHSCSKVEKQMKVESTTFMLDPSKDMEMFFKYDLTKSNDFVYPSRNELNQFSSALKVEVTPTVIV